MVFAMKTTILQHGSSCSDLIVYAHIDGSILKPVVPAVTTDAFISLFAGAGTSAYKGAVSGAGGWPGFVAQLSEPLGYTPRRTALITWSAGSQVAMEACAGPEVPDAVVMLDGLYGGKPKGSTMGDGQVLPSPGLDAVTVCATAAARREKNVHTIDGAKVETERVFVIFHSRIPTPYASSKECAEYVQRRVEEAVGEKMHRATDVDATLLDGHFFVEALALGNLRIIEFLGANAGEHIREAHLWDEAAKLWIPWLNDAGVCAGPKTAWTVPLARVLDVHAPMMRGPDVRAWQAFLVSQGLELDTDGVYGPKTSAKTQLFQRAYGLPESGALDAATFHAATGAGYVPPKPLVDLVREQMTAAGLNADNYTVALKTDADPPSTQPDGATPLPSFVDAVIARARKDIGISEDLGRNDGVRIREMGRRFGIAPGSNWCAVAVSDWIANGALDAKVTAPISGSAGAQALMGQFKAAGRWLAASAARKDPALVKAGMVPVWDRATPGRAETAWLGHTGLTTSGCDSLDMFGTIEGNSGVSSTMCVAGARRLDDPRLFGFGVL